MSSHLILVTPSPRMEVPDLTYVMTAQAQFNEAYQVPKNEDTQELYLKLIEEEHEEWIEDYYSMVAHDYEELKELADLLYVTAGLAYIIGYDIKNGAFYTGKNPYDYAISDLVSEIATGKRDKKLFQVLMYALFAYANEMGWDLHEAYKRVHHSNLSKLGDDGKPVRREDGKVMKGPNYKPPYLEDLTNGN